MSQPVSHAAKRAEAQEADGIVWESPPVRVGGSKNRYNGLRKALRESPGRWARVREYRSAQAASSSRWRFAASDAWRGYELVSSGNILYARFVEGGAQ